jgi:Protein of unknown function DUF262
MTDKEVQVELAIDSDDEFGGDYEEPGDLGPEQVTGTVVYTLDWTVKTVIDQIDADPEDPESTGVLVTSPPFQRRTAWNRDRQSLFIESLILGLPVPPIVLAESQLHEGQFYVLDGKQRLTALRLFVAEEKSPLKLHGLELLSPLLDGKTYEEMRGIPELRRFTQAMLAQPIRTIVVRNWRSPALLHLIFSRLNKASVPLASHELRQALFPGGFTNYINSASGTSKPLLRARRLTEPDFRLRDAETLLRFMALKTNLRSYRGDLRDFLDRVLKGGNDHFPDIEDDLTSLLKNMEEAIDATFEIFGEKAFLRFDPVKNKYIPRFNIAVFDVMTWFLSDSTIAEASISKADGVRHAFEELCKSDSTFAGYLTSTTKSSDAVPGRLASWGAALGNAIGRHLEVDAMSKHFLPMAARN